MLFKILHGDESRISTDITPFHEGWAYVTKSGKYFIDMNIGTVEAPNNQRVQLNAANAEALCGVSLDELKSLISTQDAVILAESQAYTDQAIEAAKVEITTQDAVILAESQAYTDAAINDNTSNLATVDKITEIDTYYGGKATFIMSDNVGISWGNTFCFIDADYNEIAKGNIAQKIPIVAGENVTFELDEENQVVKINSTGGGSSGGTIKYSEGLEYSLNYDGASYSVVGIGTCEDDFVIIPPEYEGLPVTDIGDYAFGSPAGYTAAQFTNIFIPKSVTGGMYDVFYGNEELTTIYCEAETQPDGWYPDWQPSGVTVIWGYVLEQPSNQNSLPPCDSSNEGQFLMVVSGVPTWTSIPNAEGVEF